MILTAEQLERIRQIIRDGSTALSIQAMGYQVSDAEIRRLVDAGWIEPGASVGAIRSAFEYGRLMATLPAAAQPPTWDHFQAWVKQTPMEMSKPEIAAYEVARDRAGELCVGLGNRVDVSGAAIEVDREQADRMRTIIREKVAEAVSLPETRSSLRSKLRQATDEWSRDYDRIAHTELQLAKEEGFFQATVKRAGAEAMMAKLPEPGACDKCRELYLENGKPAARPASWWAEQGSSNAGRKAKDWKAVIGAIHPFCGCKLVHLAPGWAFNDAWDMVPESMLEKPDALVEKSERRGNWNSSPDGLAARGSSLVKGKPRKPIEGQLGLFDAPVARKPHPGPYIGPKGGKWADPQRTVAWKPESKPVAPQATVPSEPERESKNEPPAGKELKIERILSVVDTREHELVEGHMGRERSVAIPGSGIERPCDRCGKIHEIHAEVELSDGSKRTVGVGCAKKTDPDVASRIASLESAAKTIGGLAHQLATTRQKLEEMDVLRGRVTAEVAALPRPPIEKKHDEQKGVEIWRMGKASVWVHDWAQSQLQERTESLNLQWERMQFEERGYSYWKHHKLKESVADLEKRLGRAEKKRGALLVEPLSKSAHRLSGEMDFNGLDIAIETRAGESRYWHDPATDEDGETRMLYPYGYIRMTEGMDGDKVDCFVGPQVDAPTVYVIHQRKAPDFKRFDEDKTMLGFPDAEAAKKAYLAHYTDPRFFGSMTEMPFEEFKRKVLATKTKGAVMIKAERLRGGKGDHRPDSDFDPERLAEGTKHEREHTDDPATAKEIAKDHLTEDKDYYIKLKKIEKSERPPAGAGWSPVPMTKHGGFRRRRGAEWEYWYPAGTHEGESGWEQHLAEMKEKREIIRQAIKLWGEYDIGRGQYALVMPDPSEKGKVRVQWFDEDGFSGHHTAADLDEIAKEFHEPPVPAKGILDKLSATERWAEGSAAARMIQFANRMRYERKYPLASAIESHWRSLGWKAGQEWLDAHAKALSEGKIPPDLEQTYKKMVAHFSKAEPSPGLFLSPRETDGDAIMKSYLDAKANRAWLDGFEEAGTRALESAYRGRPEDLLTPGDFDPDLDEMSAATFRRHVQPKPAVLARESLVDQLLERAKAKERWAEETQREMEDHGL